MVNYKSSMRPHPLLQGYTQNTTLQGSGCNIFYYDAGNGVDAPVVLIHGLGDEADTWYAALPQLGQSRRVTALDLPGFGRSSLPNQPLSIPFFKMILAEFIDKLDFQKILLVGHSMGAVIAHAFAMENPDRISGLVLVAGSLLVKAQPFTLNMLLFLIPGIGEWLYTALRRDPHAAYRTLEIYYHRLAGLPAAEQEFLFERVNQRVWSDSQRRAYFSALRSMARWVPAQQRNLEIKLATRNIPTKIIWGKDDQINPVSNARALQAAQSSAYLHIIQDAGHNVHQEKPGVILDVIGHS